MEIPRTDTEVTRVAINEYKNRQYLDFRIFYTTDEGANWLPTKKGVTFAPEKLSELKKAVELAMKELDVEEEAEE
mgnify:CR=1 FL=1